MLSAPRYTIIAQIQTLLPFNFITLVITEVRLGHLVNVLKGELLVYEATIVVSVKVLVTGLEVSVSPLPTLI